MAVHRSRSTAYQREDCRHRRPNQPIDPVGDCRPRVDAEGISSISRAASTISTTYWQVGC